MAGIDRIFFTNSAMPSNARILGIVPMPNGMYQLAAGATSWIWGESDTIYYEVGRIEFDDICQSSNIEYDLTKTMLNTKLYEMVFSADSKYEKVLIENKVFDDSGVLQNMNTFYKDGSLKENVSY